MSPGVESSVSEKVTWTTQRREAAASGRAASPGTAVGVEQPCITQRTHALNAVLRVTGVLLEGLIPSGVWNVLTSYGMRMSSVSWSLATSQVVTVPM